MEDITISMKYAAIKKTHDNDGDGDNTIRIKLFDKRDDAIEWIINVYEFWSEESDSEDCIETVDDLSQDQRKTLLMNFLSKSSNDEGVFHWEWKRKNNHRTYRIIEFQVNQELVIPTTTKDLYSIRKLHNISLATNDQ